MLSNLFSVLTSRLLEYCVYVLVITLKKTILAIIRFEEDHNVGYILME